MDQVVNQTGENSKPNCGLGRKPTDENSKPNCGLGRKPNR